MRYSSRFGEWQMHFMIRNTSLGVSILQAVSYTHLEWALVEHNHLIQRVFTEGLNPFFQTRREISRSVRLGLPETFFKRKLEQVYYYKAGCTSYEKKHVLGASLVAQFKTPIQVESDLLSAANSPIS